MRTFQRRLKERGWTIATDGNFTKQVETVVRAFQREKLLAVTGKVDAGDVERDLDRRGHLSRGG